MFLWRSTERQVNHDVKNVVIDWFYEKSWINQHFLCIAFLSICFREIWILSIFGVHLFLRMAFKRKFCVYLILRNQPKFEKFTKICTRKISTLKEDKNRKLPFKLPNLHFKFLVSFRLYLHLFCLIFPGSKILFL